MLSVGVGIGGLIGTVAGPGGHPVPYRAFVAPGLLATSALNGALATGTRGLRLIERHARLYRRMWLIVAAGAAEPLFYMLSVGVGIGGLIGTVVVIKEDYLVIETSSDRNKLRITRWAVQSNNTSKVGDSTEEGPDLQ